MRIEEDIKTTALQEAIHESEESGQCQRLLPNHTYSQLDSGGFKFKIFQAESCSWSYYSLFNCLHSRLDLFNTTAYILLYASY